MTKLNIQENQALFFFTDGYGLHKAETPKNNSRLIINAHFGRGKIFYSKNDILYNNATS